MSILGKLTVGAMAVLGAYALRGKNGKGAKPRKALSRRAGEATPATDEKRASRRAKPKAGAAARSAAGSAKARSAKAASRKRPAGRASAKRAQSA